MKVLNGIMFTAYNAIGFGFAELEDAREFEPIDERKKPLD